jgi:hypothetical protein
VAEPRLRDRLIGAWKLVSYVEVPVDGSAPRHPFGKDARGLIMYTPDGYMSAQLCTAQRAPFSSGDWFEGTDAEYRAEGSSYVAYSGPFEIDEDQQTLRHSMFVSLFPNWTGQTQARVARLEGDLLELSTAAPIARSGKQVHARLVWKRAQLDG